VEDLLDMAPDVLRHRLWVSAPEVRDRLRMLGGERSERAMGAHGAGSAR